MNILKTLAAVAALSLAALSADAAEIQHGDLTLTDIWTRATPPRARAAGGFVSITNKGTETDRLVAARADIADRVEIHEMAVTDGVMTMREMANGVEIKAGETVVLKPGGLHIMFMGLNEAFAEGTKIPVTLTFEKAGDVTIDLDVQKMGAKQMGQGAMNHGGMHNGAMGKKSN